MRVARGAEDVSQQALGGRPRQRGHLKRPPVGRRGHAGHQSAQQIRHQVGGQHLEVDVWIPGQDVDQQGQGQRMPVRDRKDLGLPRPGDTALVQVAAGRLAVQVAQ